MSWNLLDWFKSADKVAGNVLDKDDGLLTQVGGWIGNMNFTDEERAEMNLKLADKSMEFVEKTLSESTVRSKSRRNIAEMIIKMFVGIVMMVVIAAPWNVELAKFYVSLLMVDVVYWSVLSVIGFFFGSYLIGNALPNLPKKK